MNILVLLGFSQMNVGFPALVLFSRLKRSHDAAAAYSWHAFISVWMRAKTFAFHEMGGT